MHQPETGRFDLRRLDPRWPFLLLGMLVLPCLFGSAAAYAALVGALLYLPLLWRADARALIASEPAFRYDLVALGVLLVAFLITMRTWKDPFSLIDFIVLILAAPVYAAARMRSGRRALTGFASAALLGTIVAVVTGIVQTRLGHHHGAAEGFNSNPIHFADVASTLGWMAVLGVFSVKSPWRWLYLLGPVLGLIATFLAQSRGAVLAYPVLAIILFISLARPRLSWGRIALIGLAAIAVALVALSLAPGRAGTIFHAAAQFFGLEASRERSALARTIMWHAGAAAFIASPLLGYGWIGFFRAALEFAPAGEAREFIRHFGHLHNDIMDFAVAAGVAGIFAYVTFIVAPVASAIAGPDDSLRRARLCGTLLLSVGYLIYGLTNMLFSYEMQTNLYAIGAALILGLCRDPAPPIPSANG